MTRLRHMADGVLEASWLLAAALTPIFFDAHTTSQFEASKAVLVRLLALLMAAAWLVRRFETGPEEAPRERPWWRAPLALPVLAYLAAFALSTAISLAPALSFWGGWERREGFVSLAAYVVVFATVGARLRRPEALERLFDVIVVASLPVCLYGLMQEAKLDPIDWHGASFEEGRVHSTLGNPILAGAYLAIVLPLTLAWGLQGRRLVRGRWRAVLCAIAFVLQAATLVLSRSRGPWIASVAGLFLFAVLAGAVRGRRLWTVLAVAPALAGALFLLVLNVPRGPLESLRDKPGLRRFAHFFDRATPDLSGRARFLIWKAASDLSRPRPALVDGEGRSDRYQRLRPLFGYGLETLSLGFHSVFAPEFERIERRHHLQGDDPLQLQPREPLRIPDRAHNELWDTVVSAGWLGAAAYLGFYAALLALMLRVLGLQVSDSRWSVAGYFGIGGLVVGLGISDAFGWPYLGVALPFGLLAAFTLQVLLVSLRSERREIPGSWLAIGVASALLADFVEVQLGLSLAPSKLYLWLLAGVLVAAFQAPALLEPAAEPEEERRDSPRAAKARMQAGAGGFWQHELPGSLPAGLLAAAFLVTLLFDFVKPSTTGALRTLLDLLAGRRGEAQQLILAVGLACLALTVALEARRARGGRSWLSWAVAAGIALAFGALQLDTLTSVRELRSDIPSIESFARWVTAQYVIVLGLLALALGASLAPAPTGTPLGRRGRLSLALALGALVACVALAPALALRKVEAGSLLQTGQLFERSFRYPMATGLYRRAAELDFRDPRSDLQVGKAALEASRLPLPAGEIQGWLDLAEDAFERTLRLAPYDPDQLANLARLEVRLSEGVAADQAEVHKARADELYERVLRLSPNNVALLDEYAYFQYTRRGQLDEAAANLKRSMLLDPTYYFTYVVLGEIYVVKGQAPSADRLGNYRIAIAYYDHALQQQFSARIAVAAALLSVEAQDKATAVRRLEDSLRFEPAPEPRRKVHAQLARLYQELGQPAKAAEHAALVGPPPSVAPAPAPAAKS